MLIQIRDLQRNPREVVKSLRGQEATVVDGNGVPMFMISFEGSESKVMKKLVDIECLLLSKSQTPETQASLKKMETSSCVFCGIALEVEATQIVWFQGDSFKSCLKCSFSQEKLKREGVFVPPK